MKYFQDPDENHVSQFEGDLYRLSTRTYRFYIFVKLLFKKLI
jgi:hypothetical protein